MKEFKLNFLCAIFNAATSGLLFVSTIHLLMQGVDSLRMKIALVLLILSLVIIVAATVVNVIKTMQIVKDLVEDEDEDEDQDQRKHFYETP